MRVKMVEPVNPHFVKGNRAHDIAASFISGPGARRPALSEEVPVPGTKDTVSVNLEPIKAELIAMRKAKARTEQEWAFDRQWNPVDWRDWDRAWLRVKTDICADTIDPPTVDIIDLKTGKVHDEHKQQRSIYAMAGLRLVQIGALAGGSKKVELTARHVYVDTGQSATETYGMKNLEPLKREWLTRIERMMKDTTYPTKTGNHCRWCRYAKSAGGPCPEKM